MADLDASELIVAVAGPAGLVLFLLTLGWAAVERGNVHAYMREQWHSDPSAAKRDGFSVLDEGLSSAGPNDTARTPQFKERPRWHSQH